MGAEKSAKFRAWGFTWEDIPTERVGGARCRANVCSNGKRTVQKKNILQMGRY